jgi:hypothetical protein
MSLWTDRWHLITEFLPNDGEDVWFVDLHGKLGVGKFQEDTMTIAQADDFGTKLECITQWKSLDGSEVVGYPRDGATIAVELRDFPCYALGMYACRYVDPFSGEHAHVVLLDPSYQFVEGAEPELALDWRFVNRWSYAPVIKRRRELGERPDVEAEEPVEVEPEEQEEEKLGSAIIRSRKRERKNRR